MRFLKAVLKDFLHIGGISPSSRFAAQRIASLVPRHSRTVIEYGPGTGVITKAILKQMDADSTLYAIEQNPVFLESLGKNMHDTRFQLIAGDLVALNGHQALRPESADAIVSGIPFSFLSASDREHILRLTASVMKKNSVFIVYQNSPFVLGDLRRHFPQVKISFEPRNLLPYFIFQARHEVPSP